MTAPDWSKLWPDGGGTMVWEYEYSSGHPSTQLSPFELKQRTAGRWEMMSCHFQTAQHSGEDWTYVHVVWKRAVWR